MSLLCGRDLLLYGKCFGAERVVLEQAQATQVNANRATNATANPGARYSLGGRGCAVSGPPRVSSQPNFCGQRHRGCSSGRLPLVERIERAAECGPFSGLRGGPDPGAAPVQFVRWNGGNRRRIQNEIW